MQIFKMPRLQFQRPHVEYRYANVNGSYRRRRVRRRSGRSRFSRMFGTRQLASPEMDSSFDVPAAQLLSHESSSSTGQSATHRSRRQAAENAWSACRQIAVSEYVECLQLGSTSCSVPDCQDEAKFRCTDCGPQKHFCSSHVASYHQGKLHVPELWQSGCFQPHFVEQEPWQGHNCDRGKVRSVTVIDSKGRHHSVPIMFCACKQDICSLISLQLWPATPSRPVVAFTFSLMRWLRIMFLDCHVALQNLCNCISWLSPPLLQSKVKNIYKLLAEDSFTEFRYFCEQIEAMHLVPPGSPPVCPACPKNEGKQFVSLDAIFGLKRWQKSGRSDNPPRHRDTFFISQSQVDEFLASYDGSSSSASTFCSNFQASDHLRTKNRSKKVDETGVFGAVCRHEMPIKFFSLKQGERLGNAVFLIKHLLEGKPEERKLYILYDIACKLQAHLKRSRQGTTGDNILQNVQLAIPAFHVYGHKPDCQKKLSPRRLEGFCLSDGEQVERLWSFLRKFSTITKEMTPSNRIDALTDGLLQYTRKIGRNLAKLLVHRHQRAEDVHSTAAKELAVIAVPNEQDGSAITINTIRMWMTEEMRPPSDVTGVTLPSSEVYALKLKTLYDLRKDYERECLSENSAVGCISLLLRKIKRIDEEILAMEQGQPRWTEGSALYQAALANNTARRKKSHLFKLHTLCVDRWLLISLKQKYADGQAIAKLLCRQIKTATTKLKKGLENYNQEIGGPPLIFSDVCDVASNVWRCLETTNTSDTSHPTIPTHVKRQWIDIVHKLDRSVEELEQLKSEMRNTFNFFVDREKNILSLLQVNGMSKGQICLLKLKHLEIIQQICCCHQLFHPRFIDLSTYTLPAHSYDIPDENIDNLCEALQLLEDVSSDEED
ncbi:uncharacterized protein [Apostichopus japonicus]|uniref:uncharacterized protein isoform X1 n=2 Tax=Stichopus japonicus TaxID=307972 RepID=UPI003AB424FA